MDDREITDDEIVDFYARGFSVTLVDPEPRRRMNPRPMSGDEPSQATIDAYMAENPGLGWYNAREQLRSIAYGGSPDARPPGGYTDWGTYWKCY